MMKRQLTDDEILAANLKHASDSAYAEYCPPNMNRADRRTAKGRMLVAQAKCAALQAENKVLRAHLEQGAPV